MLIRILHSSINKSITIIMDHYYNTMSNSNTSYIIISECVSWITPKMWKCNKQKTTKDGKKNE